MQPASAAVQEIDAIAAVVDDDVITRNELDTRLRPLLQELRAKGAQLPPMNVLKRQLLERMIIERLQLAQAAAQGIRVGDEDLNTVIANIAARNQLKLLQFRTALERDGISFAAFREEMRNEMTIARLRNQRINKRITIASTSALPSCRGRSTT
jgi:peptidyl-prolyl cis-trans isomerase SurA